MEKVVEKLRVLHRTISTMESCTGGGVANAITNVEGASDVIKFSAVTYSNEFKIKMGVSKDVIDEFSVYSMETAIEMSKNICRFTGSDYGVGVTGKLNRSDKNNLSGKDNVVYVSIYDALNDKFTNFEVSVEKNNRAENKAVIINLIEEKLLEIM